MSAFVVSRAHIAYLVEAGLQLPHRSRHGSGLSWFWRGQRHELPYSDYERAAEVGQMLWDACVKSVLTRYPQDTKKTMPGPTGETFEYERHRPEIIPHKSNTMLISARGLTPFVEIDPVQTLKACNCYDYQSCEARDWEESEAYAYIQALKEAAIRVLPGYDDAEWEITAEKPAEAAR